MDLTNGWISEWMNAEWNIRWMMKALCGKMNAQFENEWMNECWITVVKIDLKCIKINN